MCGKILNADIIPRDVLEVMEHIREAGHRVWIVGGVLRSFLLAEEPKDWDLATDAPPARMMTLFPRVVPIGIRHGTVQVLTMERAVEVTTVPGHGDEGIVADLARRDFTVNAMAWAFPEGLLLDPHGGRGDLSDRLLRAVGKAAERFREDPLRTLRAGRFVSTHRFSVEEETFLALRQEVPGLRNVAFERIRDECVRLLLGERVEAGMDCMLRGGVIREILPEILEGHRGEGLADDPESALHHAVRTVRFSPVRRRVRLTALFHNLGVVRHAGEDGLPLLSGCHTDSGRSSAIADGILARWRMSSRDRREVVGLIEHQLVPDHDNWSDAELRRAMARVGRGLLEDWLDLALAHRRAMAESLPGLHLGWSTFFRRVEEQIKTGFPMDVHEMVVDGSDVMSALNILSGAEVGRALRRLHEMVVEDPTLNQRKFLMDFLVKAYHK